MSNQTMRPPSPVQLTVSAGHNARVYPLSVSVAGFPSSPLQLKHADGEISNNGPSSLTPIFYFGERLLSTNVCARHDPTMAAFPYTPEASLPPEPLRCSPSHRTIMFLSTANDTRHAENRNKWRPGSWCLRNL